VAGISQIHNERLILFYRVAKVLVLKGPKNHLLCMRWHGRCRQTTIVSAQARAALSTKIVQTCKRLLQGAVSLLFKPYFSPTKTQNMTFAFSLARLKLCATQYAGTCQLKHNWRSLASAAYPAGSCQLGPQNQRCLRAEVLEHFLNSHN
jgi:hypothetical protein